MPQPWFLGMDDGDMPMKPVQWTEHGVSAMAAQQRHDELLRLECMKLVGLSCSDYAEAIEDMATDARRIYHDITGREWPVWPEPRINRNHQNKD